jgi:hypothetical protein
MSTPGLALHNLADLNPLKDRIPARAWINRPWRRFAT